MSFDTFEDEEFGDFKAKLKQDDEGEDLTARFDDPFFFEWEGCEPESDIPTAYKMGLTMQPRGTVCAFKYQVTNRYENQDYKFQVVRDSAVALAASAVLATILTI